MNRSRSDSSSVLGSPVSATSSNATNSYINPSNPYILAAEHHRHGCCTKRYHCDGTKCPDAALLNPAIGIPLAICTGGLSSAACGMYTGFRDHRRRKEMKKAYAQAQLKSELPPDFVTPSPVAARAPTQEISPSAVPFAVEMDAVSTVAACSAVSEKMDDGREGNLRLPEKMSDDRDERISEIDSTPVDSLPRYSELESPQSQGDKLRPRFSWQGS